ncbi:MAG: copper chaperone [Bacteroidetes bacterium]|nr:MAG: copper chaperone [Bacteroidota bacterium]TAE62281.1 MAG: copper chaperone [Bacteroidota bacterium]TAF98034.1 MAG: copper chaperone [Bacteroidota bacterium]
MKKLLYTVVALVGFALQATSQEKKAVWATIAVPQVVCYECKERLDSYLQREKGGEGDAGIIQFKINQAAGNIRVQYYPGRIDLNYIQTAIANAGFDADTLKAEPTAYKALPPKCKRKADGGGPQKGDPCKMGPMDKRR